MKLMSKIANSKLGRMGTLLFGAVLSSNYEMPNHPAVNIEKLYKTGNSDYELLRNVSEQILKLKTNTNQGGFGIRGVADESPTLYFQFKDSDSSSTVSNLDFLVINSEGLINESFFEDSVEYYFPVHLFTDKGIVVNPPKHQETLSSKYLNFIIADANNKILLELLENDQGLESFDYIREELKKSLYEEAFKQSQNYIKILKGFFEK